MIIFGPACHKDQIKFTGDRTFLGTFAFSSVYSVKGDTFVLRMPRRRISKRRENGYKSKSKSFHKSDGKLKKWNTISDIPMDEEDQCVFGILQLDKI